MHLRGWTFFFTRVGKILNPSCSFKNKFFFTDIASTYPEPKDKFKFIERQLYNYNYDTWSALPTTWEWPSINH